jgi:hypothetical protein
VTPARLTRLGVFLCFLAEFGPGPLKLLHAELLCRAAHLLDVAVHLRLHRRGFRHLVLVDQLDDQLIGRLHLQADEFDESRDRVLACVVEILAKQGIGHRGFLDLAVEVDLYYDPTLLGAVTYLSPRASLASLSSSLSFISLDMRISLVVLPVRSVVRTPRRPIFSAAWLKSRRGVIEQPRPSGQNRGSPQPGSRCLTST